MLSVKERRLLPFGASVVAVLFLTFVSLMLTSNLTFAESTNSERDGTLITIHDRGLEKVIVTNSTTIGDAIKEAGVAVDPNDVIEPSASQKLVASDYQVNIYRARPVVIVDGNSRQKIMTAYQTAEQIISSIGLVLFSEDRAVISQPDNLIDGASIQLTITRATAFSFNLYGHTSTARTQSKTVGAMLKEKGIILTSDDRVSVDLNTIISDGMIVRVWREGKQTITVEEEVDFGTEKIEDIDQSVGYKFVKVAGANGLRSATYQITIQDGVEIARTEIASIITKEPVKEVVVVGAKGQYNTPTENENITWSYLTSQGFNRYQTAGIMGNLMQEHHFNTTDTPGGLGIVQWTGSRRDRLINMYPESYTNIYSQLEYLMYELNGGYVGVKNAILASSSLTEAVLIFQNRFEKCGVCRDELRILYAQNILASH